MSKKYNIAIIGATGAVGQALLDLIEERNFPYNDLHLCASSRSVGKKLIVNNTEYNNICKRVSDVVITTYPNKDPHHHKLDDFIKMGNKYGFKVEYCGIGNCCPRKHDIVKFIKK